MTVVRDALLTVPNTHSPSTTVREAVLALGNPKVHLLLITEHGRLLGTVTVDDLDGADGSRPVLEVAQLEGRTVGPDAEVPAVRAEMVRHGLRRLAVVDDELHLLGLLCLKAHQRDFCSDADVAARRAERLAR